MIQKKICMLGAFAVGKTSLVARYVHGIFSEKYLTTIGVKIDKRNVQAQGKDISLLLWDLHGEDAFQEVRSSYLRGAAGYFLVVDGTRLETVDVAFTLQQRAIDALGDVPFLLLVNKFDLADEWQIDDSFFSDLDDRGWRWLKTSAKTGAGVAEAFDDLTFKIITQND